MIAAAHKLDSPLSPAPERPRRGRDRQDNARERRRESPHAQAVRGRRGLAESEPDDDIVMASSPNAPWRQRVLQPPGAQLPVVIGQWLEEMPVGTFAETFDRVKKKTLAEAADKQETTLCYSTMSMVLALSRKVRIAEEASGGEMRYGAQLSGVPMTHKQLISAYNGGTCFTLAAALIDNLWQNHQVKSFVLIKEGAPMGMARWDSFTKPKGHALVEDVAEHCGHLGHVDVVVPYNKKGDRRLLILPTGQKAGARPADMSLEHFMARRHGGRLLENPNDVAYRALWGRCRLHLVSPDSKRIFGIDMIRGTMFLSSKAHKAVAAVAAEAPRAWQSTTLERSFDITKLPSRSELPMTQEGQNVWRECLIYLAAVSKVFNLMPEARTDLVFLLDRRENFLEDVVHPMARTLRDSFHERNQALIMSRVVADALRERIHPVAHDLMDAVGQCLREARRAVVVCDGEAAVVAYGQAAARAQEAASAVGVLIHQEVGQ